MYWPAARWRRDRAARTINWEDIAGSGTETMEIHKIRGSTESPNVPDTPKSPLQLWAFMLVGAGGEKARREQAAQAVQICVYHIRMSGTYLFDVCALIECGTNTHTLCCSTAVLNSFDLYFAALCRFFLVPNPGLSVLRSVGCKLRLLFTGGCYATSLGRTWGFLTSRRPGES